MEPGFLLSRSGNTEKIFYLDEKTFIEGIG